MKKKLLGVLLGTALAVSAFSFAITSNVSKKAEAYTNPSTYYSTVSGKGASLLTSLNTKIKNPSWVGYNGLKSAYTTTDVRADGKLFDIYSDATNYVPGSNYASSYTNPGDGYNREHTIPKSWWNDGTTKQGCDLYIVLPSDAKINGVRSNFPYGITTSGTSWKLSGDTYTNRFGSSTSTEYVSGSVFEPFDNRKGDLARIYFYAVAAYWSGGEGNGAVTKWTDGDGSKVFSASGNNGFVQKYLDMLLKWHKEDPVSTWEINRNNNVEDKQGNRNPFVDHPSWADLIWGGTYPSTGTNYENVVGKKVSNGQLVNDGDSPTLSSISVSGQTTSFTQGDTFSFGGTVTAHYSDSTTADVTASSTFSGYNMSTTGNQTVTVSYGGKTTTYSITVNAQGEQPSGVTINFANGGNCSSTSGSFTGFSFSTATNNSSNAPAYNSNSYELRMYYASNGNGNSLSITPSSDYKITGIVINASSASYTPTVKYNVDGGNDITGTWSSAAMTISGIEATSSLVFRNANTSSTQLRIKSIVVSVEENSSSPTPTSISATPSKTFYVGDTITKSDITVKDNLNNIISSSAYTFADNNHQFTYSEATSGGASTQKQFANTSIDYDGLKTGLTVNVKRRSFTEAATSTTDYVAADEFSGIGTSYGTEKSVTTSDNMTFTIDGYYYASGSVLSFTKRVNKVNSGDGQMKNTKKYSTGIVSVSVSLNTTTPDLELSVDGSNWVDSSVATPSTKNYYYFRLFYKNPSSITDYVNISQISVTLKGSETPTTLSDYIMFEDTNNQCTSKFDVAKSYFENMSSSDRNTFMDSEDYVISQARDRLEKWAAHLGKTIDHVNGDYVISNSNNTLFADTKNNTIIVVVISVVISSLAVAGYFLLKNKKKTMN